MTARASTPRAGALPPTPDPTVYPCPRCGAKAGQRCFRSKREPRDVIHPPRVKPASVLVSPDRASSERRRKERERQRRKRRRTRAEQTNVKAEQPTVILRKLKAELAPWKNANWAKIRALEAQMDRAIAIDDERELQARG